MDAEPKVDSTATGWVCWGQTLVTRTATDIAAAALGDKTLLPKLELGVTYQVPRTPGVYTWYRR